MLQNRIGGNIFNRPVNDEALSMHAKIPAPETGTARCFAVASCIDQLRAESIPSVPQVSLQSLMIPGAVAMLSAAAIVRFKPGWIGTSCIIGFVILCAAGSFMYSRIHAGRRKADAVLRRLAMLEKHLRSLADFIDISMSPVERLMSTSISTLSPLPSEMSAHYFVLVQLRSALRERARSIAGFLARPNCQTVREYRDCIEGASRGFVIHEKVSAKSHRIVSPTEVELMVPALLEKLKIEEFSSGTGTEN